MTVDEFDQLPDVDGIHELLEGEVVWLPPPKLRHSEVRRRMLELLESRFDRNRIRPGTGFVIGASCLGPDVAIIRAGQGEDRGRFAGAPLVAIDIASRGNTPDDLEFRKNLYLDNGAAEVWIVYDKTRTVVMHTGRESRSDDGEMHSAALDITLRVPEIFE